MYRSKSDSSCSIHSVDLYEGLKLDVLVRIEKNWLLSSKTQLKQNWLIKQIKSVKVPLTR